MLQTSVRRHRSSTSHVLNIDKGILTCMRSRVLEVTRISEVPLSDESSVNKVWITNLKTDFLTPQPNWGNAKMRKNSNRLNRSADILQQAAVQPPERLSPTEASAILQSRPAARELVSRWGLR